MTNAHIIEMGRVFIKLKLVLDGGLSYRIKENIVFGREMTRAKRLRLLEMLHMQAHTLIWKSYTSALDYILPQNVRGVLKSIKK